MSYALGVLLGLAVVALAAGYVIRQTHRQQPDGRHTPRGQARHRHPTHHRARRRDAPTRARVVWPADTAPTNPKE